MSSQRTGLAIGLASDSARLARMLRALGNPVRFQIMQTLAERRSCITQEIVATTPLAQSTVSQHLKLLRQAGLIQGEIEGPATCYCIDPAGVRWLKAQIEGWLPGCCDAGGGRRGAMKFTLSERGLEDDDDTGISSLLRSSGG